jgi:type VI protein secretion system component VasF
MFTSRTTILLCGALVFAGPMYAIAQHDHAAHAAADGNQAPTPSPRWATDADLRDGMGRIHQALNELRHYEMGHMPDTLAKERAATILDAGAYILAHCKLQPRQDAVMHAILTPLLAAAQRLKDQPDKAEVAVLHAAVADYPRYFDDPGWTSPVHADHH